MAIDVVLFNAFVDLGNALKGILGLLATGLNQGRADEAKPVGAGLKIVSYPGK